MFYILIHLIISASLNINKTGDYKYLLTNDSLYITINSKFFSLIFHTEYNYTVTILTDTSDLEFLNDEGFLVFNSTIVKNIDLLVEKITPESELLIFFSIFIPTNDCDIILFTRDTKNNYTISTNETSDFQVDPNLDSNKTICFWRATSHLMINKFFSFDPSYSNEITIKRYSLKNYSSNTEEFISSCECKCDKFISNSFFSKIELGILNSTFNLEFVVQQWILEFQEPNYFSNYSNLYYYIRNNQDFNIVLYSYCNFVCDNNNKNY